jgi:DNA-directed RNA polymerase subunit RPC12/RpoP
MTRIIRIESCAECPHCKPRVMYSQRDTEPVKRTIGYQCEARLKAYIADPATIPDWCPLEPDPKPAK